MNYAPLTAKEIEDLACMHAGVPWNCQAALVELFAIYDKLRCEGRRPFDPARLPEAEQEAYWEGAAAQAPAPVAERPTGPIDVSFADSWTDAEKIGFIEHCLRWPACGYVNSPERVESIRLAWKIASDLEKRAVQAPAGEAEPEWQAMLYAPRDGSKIELLVEHREYWVALKAGRADGYRQACEGHWVDFNGGGWSWMGTSGQPIGWRPLHTGSASPVPVRHKEGG